MTGRRQLLYISPIVPALGGNGLAMRAGMMLEALAADHDVWLLVVPVAGGDGGPPPDAIKNWCAGFASLRLDDGAGRLAYASGPLDVRESTLRGSPTEPRSGSRSAASATSSASSRGGSTGAAPMRPLLARFATPAWRACSRARRGGSPIPSRRRRRCARRSTAVAAARRRETGWLRTSRGTGQQPG